ncbi:hypothetical protein MMC25_004287 [Agyrium rufum]|nr:hypothetical protein [Agyrium rufum]
MPLPMLPAKYPVINNSTPFPSPASPLPEDLAGRGHREAAMMSLGRISEEQQSVISVGGTPEHSPTIIHPPRTPTRSIEGQIEDDHSLAIPSASILTVRNQDTNEPESVEWDPVKDGFGDGKQEERDARSRLRANEFADDSHSNFSIQEGDTMKVPLGLDNSSPPAAKTLFPEGAQSQITTSFPYSANSSMRAIAPSSPQPNSENGANAASSTRAMKSPIAASASRDSFMTTTSPLTTTPTGTADTGASPTVGFGSRKPSTISNTDTSRVGSIDSSLWGEDGPGGRRGSAVLESARQAQLKRGQSKLVFQGSKAAKRLSDLFGLSNSKGPDNDLDKKTQGKGKAAEVLGENIGLQDVLLVDEVKDQRTESDARDFAGEHATVLRIRNADDEAEAQDEVSGLKDGSRRFSLLDALRSNPPDSSVPTSSLPRRALTTPTRRRATSFAPTPIDTHSGNHRFLRQSIVSTPYPKDEHKTPSSADTTTPLEMQQSVSCQSDIQTPQAALTLVLHNHARPTIPRLGTIFVPKINRDRDTRNSCIVTESAEEFPMRESKPENRKIAILFDDQELWLSVRQKYRVMRGFPRRLLCARTLQGVRLLGYSSLAELMEGHQRLMHTNARGREDTFAEERIMEFIKRPQSGKGKSEWVEWIGALPENQLDLVGGNAREMVALEFVEGWAVDRIAMAGLVVMLMSAAATVLWIMLGVPSGIAADMGGKFVGVGFQGAGARFEGGIVFGVLVLVMGWSGLIGWLGLSYLVT